MDFEVERDAEDVEKLKLQIVEEVSVYLSIDMFAKRLSRGQLAGTRSDQASKFATLLARYFNTWDPSTSSRGLHFFLLRHSCADLLYRHGINACPFLKYAQASQCCLSG